VNSTPLRPAIRRRLHAPAALRTLPLLFGLLFLSACSGTDDWFTKAIQMGPFAMAGAALLAGLVVNLTPCVYPMIAITVSVFGARQATTRRQALLLSTCYVLGIVALLTPMVVVAGLTGSVFGTALSNTWVLVGMSAVFLAMAASSFGAFEMTLPHSVMQRLSAVGGVGYGGAFVLGLVSSLIAAPCTGPLLTSILVWMAKVQDPVSGALVGTMFSLGVGLPTWFVGTFAISLPKAGQWMLWVKSVFGIVLAVVALHYLGIAFPTMASMARPGTTFLATMAAVIAAGLLLGAVHLSWDDGGMWIKLRKAVGIAGCVAAGFLGWVGIETPERQLTWVDSEQAGRATAEAEKRPLLIDFTADWCVACKELAKHTFADPRVMQTAAHFVAIKVDATNQDDPQVEAISEKYGVKGLPTVVILDSTGQERKRFVEFVGPEVFLTAIQGVN
jgi:thioredoxin:protein disulfide reductase